MIVKTKNYRLDKKQYVVIALKDVLQKQWWAALPVAAVACGFFWIPSWWWIFGAATAGGLYLLFWWLQFYSLTKLEQGRMLFERYSYEITSQQILMKINPREGMPIKWTQVKHAKQHKNAYLLFLNKAQIIHLPFKIFNTENDRKFLGSILKTKALLK
ncbi:MAG: hypothetical protein CRN43_14055 [Candidatus Nephrothrix sp. EaCA]|nr:MAG: hypothetical protein CRN43_14055 [Candidatus Nephrothrix sp. EaCA]